MKAQRRHELKENSLIRSIKQLPRTGHQYGSRIALGVILVAIVIVVVRSRMSASAERLSIAQQSLNQAGGDLFQLQSPGRLAAPAGAEMQLAQDRQALYSDGIKLADDALDKVGSKDIHIKAQALLYKGDLNFQLANLPPLPGAATQPSLQPDEKPQELLENAEAAYSQVLAECPNETFAVTAAHFGLAAIAENRAVTDPSQWDNARQHYQAVLDGKAAQAFKSLAAQRLNLLGQLQQPILTDVSPIFPGGATRPTTAPAAPNARPTTR
jgi:hypothetical protein